MCLYAIHIVLVCMGRLCGLYFWWLVLFHCCWAFLFEVIVFHFTYNLCRVFVSGQNFPLILVFCSEQCWCKTITLVLCVNLLMTLYLAVMQCLLFHCRHISLCVGSLYTLIDNFLSGSGMMMVIRKGIEASDHVSSTVNLMA